MHKFCACFVYHEKHGQSALQSIAVHVADWTYGGDKGSIGGIIVSDSQQDYWCNENKYEPIV